MHHLPGFNSVEERSTASKSRNKSKKEKKSAVEAGEAQPAPKLTRKKYESKLAELHVELVKLQNWVVHKGLKLCVVFEGRDGAGKGGTIKAIMERVSPRIFRVIALPAPTERERSQMYVQRYLPHLPAAGEVVIWGRSWYNRAGVERVMGFCTDAEATISRAHPLRGTAAREDRTAQAAEAGRRPGPGLPVQVRRRAALIAAVGEGAAA